MHANDNGSNSDHSGIAMMLFAPVFVLGKHRWSLLLKVTSACGELCGLQIKAFLKI